MSYQDLKDKFVAYQNSMEVYNKCINGNHKWDYAGYHQSAIYDCRAEKGNMDLAALDYDMIKIVYRK